MDYLETLTQFLGKRRTTALVVAASSLAVYEFTRIHVPDFVTNRLAYRINRLVQLSIKSLAFYGSKLQLGSEIELIRAIVNFLIKPQNLKLLYPSLNIRKAKAKHVALKIYEPKSNSTEPRPTIFYFHGGAYVQDVPVAFETYLAYLADKLQFPIVAVDYRLAPENPFPIPLDDCFVATDYVLSNSAEFKLNIDKSRIILAGDSAGANITIGISNRLAVQGLHLPRMQALIYPPTQYFNFSLPSAIAHSNLETIYSRAKASAWHMGVTRVTGNHEDLLVKNYHTLLLIGNGDLLNKYKSYVSVDLIPDKYKQNKNYYANYEHIERVVFPSATSLNYYTKMLENGPELSDRLRNLFDVEISPCLADEERLRLQPRTFMIVCEYDSRKDEGLIFAERLRRAGVSVDLSFYDYGLHGDIVFKSRVGAEMRDDLINFIQINI